MHPDDERLQLFLHREVNADSRLSAAEHLASCGDCRERLFDLERDQQEVYCLLQRMDSPLPKVTAAEVAARARVSPVEWGRWAAGILLAAALAGGAYAMPGSPLRDWMRGVGQRLQDSEPPPKPVEFPVLLLAGLAVPPGERLVIRFETEQPQSWVHVSIGAWTEVRVRGPSSSATFGSKADTLRIGNRDSTATFEIEIPRDARKVEIGVAGMRVFAKDGSRIAAPDASEGQEFYLFRLTAR
jgi:hypothetical protein